MIIYGLFHYLNSRRFLWNHVFRDLFYLCNCSTTLTSHHLITISSFYILSMWTCILSSFSQVPLPRRYLLLASCKSDEISPFWPAMSISCSVWLTVNLTSPGLQEDGCWGLGSDGTMMEPTLSLLNVFTLKFTEQFRKHLWTVISFFISFILVAKPRTLRKANLITVL